MDDAAPQVLTSDVLRGERVRHAFCTRMGGVSAGIYAGMNCGFGSDDETDNVAVNRRAAIETLNAGDMPLLTAYQQHTATALYVDHAWEPGDAPVADGMVTDRPGLALGILTADCAPVLLADGDAGVIGAAHAGWRGALDGILGATIDLMVQRGARRELICAAIGPCIAQESYEVGAEFRERFVESDPATEQFFIAGVAEGKFQFDLTGFVESRLHQAGIGAIRGSAWDTYVDEARFYSYRRSVHRGEEDYGREVSLIALAPESSP
jgi:YfiH family protein